MKKDVTEHYVEVNRQLGELKYRLACLERMKEDMIFEDYMRERSILSHKIECLNARIEGRWKRIAKTYKCEGYE